MKSSHRALFSLCLMLLSATARAETTYSPTQHTTHSSGGASQEKDVRSPTTTQREPGQAAFAAIAEIVVMLRADPRTDWAQVNIGALRDHLSDMNLLVLETKAHATPVPGGLEIEVVFEGPGGAAARRMVPAHAPVLAAETGWTSTVSRQNERGLIWTVVSGDSETQIRALGFYGLMALGDHHREHHLGIARGTISH